MSKIAVMVDSNASILPKDASKYGIYVLPMPIYINDNLYYENKTIYKQDFFRYQEEGANIRTSSPLVGELLDMWDNILRDYDEIIYLPMSSGLSGSCGIAQSLAVDYKGKVKVIDNQRISVPQFQAALDAQALAREGKSGDQIAEYLMKTKFESSIYICVNTLTYLKKSGRVTAAGAAIGNLLHIKPVLTIQGEKLDAFTKVRGIKGAKKAIISALEDDKAGRFANVPAGHLRLQAAYTCSDEDALVWKKQLEEHFGCPCDARPLPLVIAGHTGYGAVAAAFTVSYLTSGIDYQ